MSDTINDTTTDTLVETVTDTVVDAITDIIADAVVDTVTDMIANTETTPNDTLTTENSERNSSSDIVEAIASTENTIPTSESISSTPEITPEDAMNSTENENSESAPDETLEITPNENTEESSEESSTGNIILDVIADTTNTIAETVNTVDNIITDATTVIATNPDTIDEIVTDTASAIATTAAIATGAQSVGHFGHLFSRILNIIRNILKLFRKNSDV